MDSLLQRKWQQLQLPSAGSAVKAKEGESQWSSFFYSLFDKVRAAMPLRVCATCHVMLVQGGSEAGSTKARADKTKKLADYDRRLQEAKESVALWMNQMKTIVDVSASSV